MDQHTTCIRLRGLTKRFDTTTAVDGIDLDIGTGEIVALLGPNGAGKTTTLDMVLGFTAPTAGTVEIFGMAPQSAVAAGRVSAVLQTGGLLRDLTVGETVELIASTFADPPPAAEVMARAGITDIADRLVSKASGGEQQRLRFALALLADPDLLILDEPTAGMDVAARQTFWAAMREEARRGRTIVFATHYLQEAEDFAERIVLIADGRIVADGPTADVRRQASGRKVRARFRPEAVSAAITTLAARPGVVDVHAADDRITVVATDSDDIARLVLGPLGGCDVEIEAASLEQAFVALTQPDTEPTPA